MKSKINTGRRFLKSALSGAWVFHPRRRVVVCVLCYQCCETRCAYISSSVHIRRRGVPPRSADAAPEPPSGRHLLLNDSATKQGNAETVNWTNPNPIYYRRKLFVMIGWEKTCSVEFLKYLETRIYHRGACSIKFPFNFDQRILSCPIAAVYFFSESQPAFFISCAPFLDTSVILPRIKY